MDKEKEPGVEFFMGELMKIEAEGDRRYGSLALRVQKLERKGKSQDDPEAMLGQIFMGLMLLQLAPLVIELIRKWLTESKSSELSL